MFDLYSKRKAKASGKEADVYQYDELPEKLRVQICHVVNNIIGDGEVRHGTGKNLYSIIEGIVTEEEGIFFLPFPGRYENGRYDSKESVINYFLSAETDKSLDVVELFCRLIVNACSKHDYKGSNRAEERSKEAIDTINKRFIENATGYQYLDQEILRVDSQLIHSEAVVPAIEVLRLPRYKGAQSEFLKAHEHYRHGRNSEVLVECYKSFESLMKAICDKRKWSYKADKSAQHLIDVCIRNDLFPRYQENYMTGLKMVLESAVPTPRNKTAAHGAGVTPVIVPAELASYVLHLTASTLLFLANADEAKP